MQQLSQILRNGTMEIFDVPIPSIGRGDVLIRTHFSFVSVGTERMKVTQARMNLAEKAANRPDQVAQVLDTLKQQGLAATVRKVQERLNAPTTLGYAVAGEVVAVGADVQDFVVGDRVAATGEGLATHAEYNSVPRNQVVAVPAGVPLDQASSTSVGAIALQAIRQAKLELGETVAIIGTGLLGQFLVQLCRANGCRVLAIDPDPSKQELALRTGADIVCGPDLSEALTNALRMSGGQGVDAVMITTAVKDLGPIEMASAILRENGRAVCLGITHIELDWRVWATKQLDFLFTRAMGPGTFDNDYALRGRDYPVGHVRWSANRNMAAFLDLIEQGKIDVNSLLTHRFPFSQAPQVFDGVANGELSSAVGIVLEYPNADNSAAGTLKRTKTYTGKNAAGQTRLGVIGAGNYLKSMILPRLTDMRGVGLDTICTARGLNADALARRFGFRVATTDTQEVFGSDRVDAVVVATRHDSHARYALEALQSGKHVYVEKPLALDAEQLQPIIELVTNRGDRGSTLWVGHNRRYAPLSQKLMDHFNGIPSRQVDIVVRSAGVDADSWYQDPVEGGGMLFGDVCHFIDLAIYYSRSQPTEIQALETSDASHREEAWAIQMKMASGGVATVRYTCGSQDGLPKEEATVLGAGRSAVLTDFRSLVLRDGESRKKTVKLQPDYGQKAMLERMFKQFRGQSGVDDTDSFVLAAQALLAVRRSIQESRSVRIAPTFPYTLS